MASVRTSADMLATETDEQGSRDPATPIMASAKHSISRPSTALVRARLTLRVSATHMASAENPL
eukprot:3862817-Prorocentrum_lima.AAC.1